MESKQSDLIMRYREYAEFQFAIDGEGLGLRSTRQALADHGILPPVVMELDALVIETLGVADFINPALLDDAQNHPLTDWWQHLGKLRVGTYPASMLPLYLRAIYQPALKAAA